MGGSELEGAAGEVGDIEVGGASVAGQCEQVSM